MALSAKVDLNFTGSLDFIPSNMVLITDLTESSPDCPDACNTLIVNKKRKYFISLFLKFLAGKLNINVDKTVNMKKINVLKLALISLSVILITSCTSGRYYSTGRYVERYPVGYYDYDYYPQSYPVIIDNGRYSRSHRIYDSRNYRGRYDGRTYNNVRPDTRNNRNNNVQQRRENQQNVDRSKSRIFGRNN